MFSLHLIHLIVRLTQMVRYCSICQYFRKDSGIMKISSTLPRQKEYMKRCAAGIVLLAALLLAATIYIVIQVKSSEIQPFIYFQF